MALKPARPAEPASAPKAALPAPATSPSISAAPSSIPLATTDTPLAPNAAAPNAGPPAIVGDAAAAAAANPTVAASAVAASFVRTTWKHNAQFQKPQRVRSRWGRLLRCCAETLPPCSRCRADLYQPEDGLHQLPISPEPLAKTELTFIPSKPNSGDAVRPSTRKISNSRISPSITCIRTSTGVLSRSKHSASIGTRSWLSHQGGPEVLT